MPSSYIMEHMKIAILGASGFIGSNLIKILLKNTDFEIVAISRDVTKINDESPRLIKISCDIFDTRKLQRSLEGVDVLYFFLHMMAQKKQDYAVAEDKVAHIVGKTAENNGIKKIIFLGGLGRDSEKLSKHLKSRHHSGEVLRQYSVSVIEFRASMVIGQGSISYEIIKNLIHKLPILTVPKWSNTLTQPIGLQDVMLYLQAGISLPDENEIIEIGGPEVMTYKKLMRKYSIFIHKKVILIDLPIIPVTVSAWWLNLFTPKNEAKVGRAMVESLANQMTVDSNRAKKLFPEIKTTKIEEHFV